jgi:uncharacterized tellurite resistance protein B-like protein
VGLLDWLRPGGVTAESIGSTPGAVSRIAAALDALPPERARFVAAFAYHLGRIAHADHVLSDDEIAVMRTLVSEESGLPAEQIGLVVDLVAHESFVFRGTEDYRVMREFDELATHEQKLALIRCMFAVSAADAHVVTKEDNEIRQVALALKVSHDEFVTARNAVRQHLAVLKKQPAPAAGP